MRHKDKHGIAYSVFQFGHSRQMFLVGEPEECYTCQGSPDYPRQVRNLLENVKAVCIKEGFTKNVAYMSHFFIADIGMKELLRQLADKILPRIFGGAATIVPQVPASGARIALELWAVGGKSPHVVCKPRFPSAVATFDEMRWLFVGECQPGSDFIGTYKRSYSVFDWLDFTFEKRKFRLNQALRTWIYQGHLLSPEGNIQRYKELNRARTDFFSDTQFLKKYLPKKYKGTVYPASTGIGADDYDVVISAIALDTRRKDVLVVPLENPNQTSAFDYGAEYSPQSPKFSRAVAVAVEDTCLIFISGTASITDSESQHPENPIKQTEQTLDNIAALIAGDNLVQHGISGFACGLDKLLCVRVYVKRLSDLDVIREVCQRRLPDVPTLYTIADICRPELLVEIEGIAHAKGNT